MLGPNRSSKTLTFGLAGGPKYDSVDQHVAGRLTCYAIGVDTECRSTRMMMIDDVQLPKDE